MTLELDRTRVIKVNRLYMQPIDIFGTQYTS